MQEETRQKYRRKPVVIEARRTPVKVTIETLEGTMVADPGDWLIIGIEGESYPCKDSIFRKTYELAEGV